MNGVHGQELKRRREAAGLSQLEAAARVGVSQPTWSKWESGTHAPRGKRVDAIDAVLGANPEPDRPAH